MASLTEILILRGMMPIESIDGMTGVRADEESTVRELLDYEKQHARRMPIQLVLQRRIDALKSGAATPVEGGGTGAEGGDSVGGGSKVSGTSRKAGGGGRTTLKVNPGGR